jgi:hypothetical protein
MQCFLSFVCPTLTYHTIQLANYAVIVTIHLPYKVEAHGFIDLCVRLIPTTFQIASYSLRISLLRDFFEQSSTYPFSLLGG